MRVLLTGGAGFIGSHTCVELLEGGCDVVIADNFSNSKPEVLNRIKTITGREPVFYEADVTDRTALSKIFEEQQIDAVVHFAGYKAVGESVAKPIMYYRNNLDSTLTLLEVMNEYGVKRIVFSSSATVYGESNEPPYDEGMPISTCTNPYGWTKLMSEQILRDAAAADKELSVVLLRYFNPIGAHSAALSARTPRAYRTICSRMWQRSRAASCLSSAFSATITPRRTARACVTISTLWTSRAVMWRRLSTQRTTRARRR